MLISKLNKSHNRKAFDCGNPILNDYIQKLASQVTKRNEAVIYVAHDGDTVTGYYCISNSHIMKDSDLDLLKKYPSNTTIPCVLLGRFAVDKNYQGQGLGKDLLLHSMITIKKSSEIIGIAFIVVDAKDDNAKTFYENYGFSELMNEPLKLCYPVNQIPNS